MLLNRGGQGGSVFLIHLVDDDDAVRTTLARMLVLSGYSVREYSSGAELLEAADELSGCILLDLHMPDADGFAVHEALKDRSVGVPVILVTGADDAAAAALATGIAGVIQKPFRRADLLSLIEKICGISPAGTSAP